MSKLFGGGLIILIGLGFAVGAIGAILWVIYG